MSFKDRNHILVTYKNLTDDYFDQIEAADAPLARKTWQKLAILLGNNKDAADAFCKTLTPGRLKIIKMAAMTNDGEIIDAALEIHAALKNARVRQAKESHDGELSLEAYAEKNAFQAIRDKKLRLAADKPRSAKANKPANKKNVSKKVLPFNKSKPK